MKNFTKINSYKNDNASNQKVLRDIQLYEKIFLSPKYHHKKQQSISIRRLLPNIQYSQYQQSTLNTQQKNNNTQLDQDTSYSIQYFQDSKKNKISTL